jgi:hypothetical protein
VRVLVLSIAASLAFAGPAAAKSKHCDRHSAKAQKACERQQVRKRQHRSYGITRSEEDRLDRAQMRNTLQGISDRLLSDRY